jgi:hypothetical protein
MESLAQNTLFNHLSPKRNRAIQGPTSASGGKPMKPSLFSRIIGVLLVIAAVGGLIFSIFGVITIWRYKSAATQGLQNSVDLLQNTLQTSAQGLAVTQDSLDGAIASLTALQSTLDTTADTIATTEPVIESVSTMMDSNIPETIAASQTSLKSAQASAQVIDGVLKTISSLPIIGSGVNYNPQTSLADSLGQIADSLDGLPNSFVDMGEGLQDTTHNLQIMQVDFALMVDAVRQIETSVEQYKEVVAGYQESIKQVQAQLDLLGENVPTAVNVAAWALTIFLVWMAIAQIGLFTQGLERLSPRSKE